MIRAVFLQIGATVLAALGFGVLVGTQGAISAGLGGLACVLPNAWFALRLRAVSKRGDASPANFFIGEFIKIAATIGLLAIAIKAYPPMHWPGLISGMVIALQASFIAFWKKS